MNGMGIRSASDGNTRGRLARASGVLRLFSRSQHVALAIGVAVLICATWAGCNGFFISPTVSSIYITPSASTLAVSSTETLTATANYSDGSSSTLTGSSVGWSSSETTIASITSPGGVVTAVGDGTATITASYQNVSATATVNVSPSNVTTLTITTTQGSTSPQSTASIAGAPATLQFYAYANQSTSQDVTNAVTWSSSNTAAATISTGLSSGDGVVTSVAAGTTNITATITNTTTGAIIASNTIALTVQ